MKGTVYRAIAVKGFTFSWCVVKTANAYALEDHCGRDMRDRLAWQAAVLASLAGVIRVPAVLSFKQHRKYAVLAMEWMEGEPLAATILALLAGRSWRMVDPRSRSQIIGYYIQVVDTVIVLHRKGYIHRDLAHSNFILTPGRQVCLIDFELAYNQFQRMPYPPYQLGTPGYISRNQACQGTPVTGDDLFALGSLLVFFLTGEEPDQFYAQHGDAWFTVLEQLTDSVVISTILKNIFTAEDGRYDLQKLKGGMETYATVYEFSKPFGTSRSLTS